jgi:hypothetical protein
MDFLKYKSRNSIYNSYKSKYLGIHLTKEVKDYYNETLIKEVEEDTHTHTHTHSGETSHFHGLEESILLKCPYYSR